MIRFFANNCKRASARLAIRVLEATLILAWCLELVGTTDAYASYYVVCAMWAAAGLFLKGRRELPDGRSSRVIAVLFAGAFAMASVLANYAYVHGFDRLIVLGGVCRWS